MKLSIVLAVFLGLFNLATASATYNLKNLELLVSDTECAIKAKDIHARFDLSDLKPTVFSSKADSFHDYKYLWALCKNLSFDKIPAESVPACDPKKGQVFAALQIQDNNPAAYKCNSLGNVDNGNMEMQILESDGMIDGVAVTYKGGDEGIKQPRTLIVEYRCSQDDVTPAVSVVQESTTDVYTAVVRSVHACPTACITNLNTGELCSRHGVCAIDTTAKAARCFCNKGFSGDSCDDKEDDDDDDDDESATPTLIGLNITLLVLIMGVSGFVIYKTKEIVDGDSSYARMDDDTVVPANNATINSDEYMYGNDVNYVGRGNGRATALSDL